LLTVSLSPQVALTLKFEEGEVDTKVCALELIDLS
jgi:hypothetical protein